MLLKLGKVLHGMQKDQKEKKGEEGFTLIELLVVVIIIGILAAIAIPVFLAQRSDARQAVVNADLRQAGSAISTCLLENSGASCNTDTELDGFGFNGSTDVTRTWGGTGDIVTVTGVHVDDTAITNTFSSDTGQLAN